MQYRPISPSRSNSSSSPNRQFLWFALAILIINFFVLWGFSQPRSLLTNTISPENEDDQLQNTWLSDQKGYSILMPTHSGRADYLIETLKFYTKNPQEYPHLNHIYVYWNDKNHKPVPEKILKDLESDPILSSKITLFQLDSPSMMQRLNISLIDSNEISFASIDDDFRIPGSQLEYLYTLHRISPHSLIGYYARYADWKLTKMEYKWQTPTEKYNLVLTGACFLSRTNIARAWSEEFTQGRELVIRDWNCEDLFMNAVALMPPIAVESNGGFDIKAPQPISSTSDHMRKRHECLNLFREWYGVEWLKRENKFKMVEWGRKVVK